MDSNEARVHTTFDQGYHERGYHTYLKWVQTNENILKCYCVLIDSGESKEPTQPEQRYHYQRGTNSDSKEQEQNTKMVALNLDSLRQRTGLVFSKNTNTVFPHSLLIYLCSLEETFRNPMFRS